jgi:hypothetical protein
MVLSRDRSNTACGTLGDPALRNASRRACSSRAIQSFSPIVSEEEFAPRTPRHHLAIAVLERRPPGRHGVRARLRAAGQAAREFIIEVRRSPRTTAGAGLGRDSLRLMLDHAAYRSACAGLASSPTRATPAAPRVVQGSGRGPGDSRSSLEWVRPCPNDLLRPVLLAVLSSCLRREIFAFRTPFLQARCRNAMECPSARVA